MLAVRPANVSGRPRRLLVLAVKICVSASLVIFLLAHSGLDTIGQTLRAVNIGWLVAGLALGIGAAALQANQWRGLLLAFGLRRTFWRCFRLDTAARLFDAALPTSIGGDVVRVGLGTAERSETARVVLTVALRRVMSIPGLMLMILVALLLSWHLDYSARVRTISLICLSGGLAGAVLLFAAAKVTFLRRIKLPRRLHKIRASLLDARAQAAGETHPFWRATLRGLAFWIVVVLSQTCYIRAVGIDAPIEYAAAVITCVNAISMLPISVGGYGLREGAFSALLAVGSLGTAAQGTAVGLILSAQTLGFGLIGALVYLSLGLKRASTSEPPIESTPAPSSSPAATRAESPALTLDPS